MSQSPICNVANRTIFCHDNLEILQGINTECIDLIYLDPPFNKKKVFTAPIGSSAEGASFKDIFTQQDVKEEWVQEIKEDWHNIYELLSAVKNIEGRTSYNFCYLAYMAIRLIECHRILKQTGSIYLHCDPTMSHHIKLLLDCIFNEQNYRNEIVWHYANRFSRRGQFFSWMNDVIFFYSKSTEYLFNNQAATPSDRTLRSYERGWDNPGDALLVYDKHKARDKIKQYQNTDKPIKYTNPKQVNMGNVWTDINIINSQAKERTGYPTQKPLALLERIIKASSNTDDVVLDPFCGCATTCVAAEKLQRKWIGIDISQKAHDLVRQRLNKEVKPNDDLFKWDTVIHFTTTPPTRDDETVHTQKTKFVYVISHPRYTGEYKVGIASNVKNRLTSYQTGDPDRAYKLEYSMATPYYRETEAFIHTKYQNKHEWVHGELADIIKDIENYRIQQDTLA